MKVDSATSSTAKMVLVMESAAQPPMENQPADLR